MHNLIRSPITKTRAIGAAVLALAIFALVMTQFVFTGETTHAQADNPPAAPTGLMASAVTHESLTLRWDEPQDASITHYQILRRNPATQDPGIFSTINSNTGSDDTSYTDSTVSYETKYVYRVVAVNSAGHSPRSNYVNITTGSEPDETPTPTPAPEPVPSEPTGLTAPTVTHDSVSLSWNDPDDDSITHYKILRRNPQTDNPGQFTTIESNTGSSATFYTDSTVASETKYVYRVVAVNEAGDSPQSGYVNVSTPAEASPPAAPAGLSASAPDANTVNLSWNDPSDDSIDGYRILQRLRDGKKYGDNKGPAGFTTLVNDTRSADTSYTDRTVTAQTRYEYRIKARSADLLSTASDTVQTETPAPRVGTRSSHATLSGITVDGNAVPGFAADRSSYEYGVANATTRVTVAATAAASDSTAAVTSPTDADTGTTGHQVNLSPGKNTARITVTANDSSTATYTLNINRGVTNTFGWNAERDFDILRAATNNNPKGIWSNGTTMWVADSDDDKLYAYNLSTKARDSGKDFNTLRTAGNTFPTGIWSDRTTMWVADSFEDKIYAYNLTSRERDSSKDFNTLGTAGNNHPQGIWSDDTTMWVADLIDKKLYAYNLTSKERDTGKEFNTLDGSGPDAPTGIWSGGATMWIADSNDDKIYAYNLNTKAHDSSKDFNTLLGTSNNNPDGLWSDGTTMWVADYGDDKLYAYNIGISLDLTAIAVDGTTISGFSPGDTSPHHGVSPDKAQVTVATTREDSKASVVITSPADANTGMDGHQVDLSDGANAVTITVSFSGTKTYNLSINRGVYTLYGWAAQHDFATLALAGNGEPWGIWSDGTTMWVADSGDAKIYAYNLATKARDPSKDFTSLSAAGNNAPTGMWSDGTTMWVADWVDTKIYAYNLTSKARDIDKEFDEPLTTRIGNIRGIWSNGTTLWAADADNKKLYAFNLSTKARESAKDFATLRGAENNAPQGIWSDLTTMWVIDSSDDKAYAYNMTSRERDASKDFNTLNDAGNNLPFGTWSNGRTMWVADSDDDKLYAYNVAERTSVPDAPSNIGAESGDTEVTLTWDDPDNDTLTTYQYRVSADGGTTWNPDWTEIDSSSASTVSHIVASLTNGTEYTFEVRAVNSTGNGVSAQIKATPKRLSVATLSGITVNGAAVPGFDADRSSYEYGVSSTTTQVTIATTVTDSGSTATITSPDDADTDATGHQVDLSAGKNAITITVTNPSTATGTYTVNVNRGVADAYGWNAEHDLDTLIAGGSSPQGMWSDGTTIWVVHSPTNRSAALHAYNLADGSRDTSQDFNTLTAAGNTYAAGIWSDRTTMWVSDQNNTKIYAYRMSDTTRDPSRDFNTLAAAGNTIPTAIWSDGTTMWVSDAIESKVYAYRMSDKARDSTKDFNTLEAAGNDAPYGIWSDGTTMWVSDNTESKIYAYRMTDKARDSSKDFNTLAAAGNTRPRGIWSNGTTTWVADINDEKLYAYNLPPSKDARLKDLTVSPKNIIGFDRDRTSYEVGVASTVARATVSATANHRAASVFIVPTDVDDNTPGHQVDLASGKNLVGIVITAQDGTNNKKYTVNINRGVTEDYGWNADQDLDGLIAAGQSYPVGIWGNATTIWVTGTEDEKLYAYRRSDGSRDSAKDFDTLEEAGNTSTVGIWSDDTTMWVTDQTDAKIYAYRMSDKARDPSKDFNTLYRAGNRQPKGIWSDRTTMWVADNGDEKLFAYRMSDKARDSSKDFDTLEAAGNDWSIGIWSDGTTMWVSDQKDYKIYAYRMSDTARDSSRDFNSLNTTTSSRIWGIWSDGTTMWVIDRAEKKVYAYNMPFPPLTGLTATAGNGRVTLRWDNPDLSEITAYQYRVRDDDGTTWSPDWTNIPSSNGRTTSYTVRSLTNGITYTFEVKGTTSGAQQPPARETATPLGPPTAPGAPRNLDVASRDASLFATWDPPKEDERAPITDYRVRYRRASSSGRLTNVSRSATYNGPAQLVSDLTNGTTYEIQVSSVNRIGASAWTSATGTAQVQEDPPSDDGLAELNVGALTAYWTDGPRSYDPHSRGDDNLLRGTCVETANFRVFWAGPDNGDNNSTPDAISWDAHVIAKHEPSTYEYYFGPEPDGSDFVRMYGMVDMQGSTVLTIRVRGLFDDQGWGQWSPPTSLYCFAD